jgi:hypothetical protein
MNKLWGISGSNGIGKDTVGKLLQARLGDGYTIEKFANIPVQCYKLITGIDFHDIPREEKEEIRADFIQFCQGMKTRSDSIWVEALFKSHKQDSKWIITDVRFIPEVKAIKKRGGLLIMISEQPLSVMIKKSLSQKGYNYFLVNDEDIEALSLKVQDIIDAES